MKSGIRIIQQIVHNTRDATGYARQLASRGERVAFQQHEKPDWNDLVHGF